MNTTPISSAVSSAIPIATKTEPSTALSAREVAQREQNVAILESQQLSLSSKSEPLALLLRTAIEGINKELEPYLGANAIESSVENQIDVSPQATAARIVNQSTAFFSAFQKNNSELDFAQQLEKFVAVISGGIDRGFAEARQILDGLKVLDQGDIAANIDQTYDLVQSGLQGFRQRQAQNNNEAV